MTRKTTEDLSASKAPIDRFRMLLNWCSRNVPFLGLVPLLALLGIYVQAGFLIFHQANPSTVFKVSSDAGGNQESCLSCHASMEGFQPAHDPKAIGCSSCHLGNVSAMDKNRAHKGMTLTPGNLSVVHATCGKCHGDIESRIRVSLMNTMSGVVAVDKYTLGETRDPNRMFDVGQLGTSPAEMHLRNLCVSCHLGHEKASPGEIDTETRGGGCSACHLDYSPAARAELTWRGRKGLSASLLIHHPGVSIGVTNKACFGCHSRSDRISTNFEGWHETQLDEATAKQSPNWRENFRFLADGRVFDKQLPDVHFEKGMECVDCHVAQEIMGDKVTHRHEEEAVKISCIDCHEDRTPITSLAPKLDSETQLLIARRNLEKTGRRFVMSTSGQVAYPNVFLTENGQILLKRKNSNEELRPKAVARACGRDILAHQQLECRACHSAWTSRCINCHTTFDSKAIGWDNLTEKEVVGAWQEKAGNFQSGLPTLGLEETVAADGTKQERVATFAPGMVLTIDSPTTDLSREEQFHRFYAPTSPHTITTHSRDCRSCHNDPVALGYGQGKLRYVTSGISGEWKFEPSFPRSDRDGLPLDAWIAFLQEPTSRAATRITARPFGLREQQRILLVGACLQCHSENEARIAAVFSDFTHYREKLSRRCILPNWVKPSQPD